MSSTWASVVPAGTVPKDTAHHFDGLSARPGAPVSSRSPRVRGNLHLIAEPYLGQRSIPACAGEPGWLSEVTPKHRVYPRVCGGTSAGVEVSLAPTGLSPRVRGNLTGPGSDIWYARVYPRVCGGTSLGQAAISGMHGSIPACAGGTIDDMVARQAQQGLSPRVRGNRFILFVAAIVDRSIPACAGEPFRGHWRASLKG